MSLIARVLAFVIAATIVGSVIVVVGLAAGWDAPFIALTVAAVTVVGGILAIIDQKRGDGQP